MNEDFLQEQSLGELVILPPSEVIALIKHDPSLVSRIDNHRKTLLHHAAEVGQMEVAAYLVHAGSPVNALDDTGRTPLHWAANYGHLAILEMLLSLGARHDIVDKGGLTPLRWAEISRSGNGPEAVAILERFGAKQ